jgi:hypothetical protein
LVNTPDKEASLLRRILRGVFTVFAALWIFLEEWIWDSLTAIMAWLGRLPIVHRLEARIARLSPYAAMTAFIVPWLVLIPAKVLALWLIASGHGVLGIEVFIVAKVIGTALLARLFTLTRPALLTIGWFARFYARFSAWRERMYAYVKSLPAWQQAKAWIARVRESMRAWYRAHFGS